MLKVGSIKSQQKKWKTGMGVPKKMTFFNPGHVIYPECTN